MGVTKAMQYQTFISSYILSFLPFDWAHGSSNHTEQPLNKTEQEKIKGYGQMSEDQQKKYQKLFSVIADSDIDTNSIEVWTQNRERYEVVKGITEDVSNGYEKFKDTSYMRLKDSIMNALPEWLGGTPKRNQTEAVNHVSNKTSSEQAIKDEEK